MSGKHLYLLTSVALLCSIGAATAREAVRLTDAQLDRVTAGADLSQIPFITSLLANGSNGPGGVNQFSPSIATLVPTLTNINVCVLCVTAAQGR
jgi:hypothetical protein